jgi:sugar O-acyltransferase (sialic acid O-acetyltransferase NeuD family)
MEPIILIGGGGHCKSCIDVIEQQGKYKIAGIVDEQDKIGKSVLGYKFIATDDQIGELAQKYNNFLITIGQIKSSEIRIRIFLRLEKLKVNLPVIISPYAYVSKHAIIDKGTVVMHHALVNAGVKIGPNSIINSKALLEHGSTIHSHCHISTSAVINGDVIVKKNSFVGSGAIIREGVLIGKNSFIKADTIVKKDFL